MVMRKGQVVGMCVDAMPSFLRQHRQMKNLDFWVRARQMDEDNELGGLFVPNTYTQTEEHLELSQRAYTPGRAGHRHPRADHVPRRRPDAGAEREPAGLGGLAAQRLGRGPGRGLPGRAELRCLLRLGAARQRPAHRRTDAEAEGLLAAADGRLLRRDDDEFPLFTLDCERYTVEGETGWTVTFIDEEAIHHLSCKGDGTDVRDWTYIDFDEHFTGVTPVVRYANMLDLDGRTMGEIEPVIPLLRRIDQDTYDRLIVQRYGAWKIRYITGLVKPKEMTDAEYREGLLKLKVGDFLTATDKDTKFGTLEETQLAGFISASRQGSAGPRRGPPDAAARRHRAGAADAAREPCGDQRKPDGSLAGAPDQLRRVPRAAVPPVRGAEGNAAEANAWNMQVRWRDTETRSLSQTADALGKVATQLKVPVEMLWERIEGWTDSDTERAKNLIQDGTIDQLLAQFEANGLLGGGTGQPAPLVARWRWARDRGALRSLAVVGVVLLGMQFAHSINLDVGSGDLVRPVGQL
jgi:hypothetical protein